MNALPDIWSEEALLRKAQVYVERAHDVEADSGLEQLFYLVGLELLARAAVARVHPALLADPQDGQQLLYAFGYGDPKPPKSVPIATVFRRCRVVVPLFTEDLVRDGVALMTLRNEELHSAGTVLETLKSSAWHPQYFRICEVLLQHLELELDDFFPPERASSARTLLDGLAQDVESVVKQRVADQARWFEARDHDEQTERRDLAQRTSKRAPSYGRAVVCPACGCDAVVTGEVAAVSEARLGDGEIERDVRMLPTRLRCAACELNLDGHAEMFHAGLGDEYTLVDTEDPLEYYGIDPKEYVTIEDLVEPDYGND